MVANSGKRGCTDREGEAVGIGIIEGLGAREAMAGREVIRGDGTQAGRELIIYGRA